MSCTPTYQKICVVETENETAADISLCNCIQLSRGYSVQAPCNSKYNCAVPECGFPAANVNKPGKLAGSVMIIQLWTYLGLIHFVKSTSHIL